ncbi:sugar phosphate isomerase/epimerase family protein [Yinghuangia seranimata]|uniref:sugar phosphate isomerase/epimerase family protein n=1 Tax=Yinghuangia seranimata TaxID=408067 RepID=UPI00248C7127|nr:sugar phosphate isomerase/epimerase [Yinghuangia seranimata]MDI2125614.1 sugar phosphate isomerase/epimerase [Yinghuangia seranimata]
MAAPETSTTSTTSATSNAAEPLYAVDLITFYHPAFWGLDSYEELVAKTAAEPRWFWDRCLGALRDAGITGLEMTFPPGDRHSAVAAYGSPEGFAEALKDHGLTLVSGFFADIDRVDWRTPDGRREVLRSAADYADFLQRAGGTVLVAGLPLRRTLGALPASFVDMATAEPLAALLNEIGHTTLRHGVRLALHTEAHSMLCTGRDVDLFMLLTDPMYVGLCPDTAHLTLSGADPVHVVSRHRERIVIAHWKDALGPAPMDVEIDEQVYVAHQPYFCPLGSGVVDWFAWARLMREIGFTAPTLLELDMAPDPVAEMRAARRFVSTALAPLYT